MTGWKKYLSIAAIVIVLLGAGKTFYQYHNDLADARSELQSVQKHAKAQLVFVAKIKASADSAQAAAAKSAIRAERAEARLAAAKTAPDSLPAAIEAKDEWHQAYESEKVASAKFRIRGDSLESIVRDYGDASKHILKATKPSFLGNLLPDVGVGAAVGIDPLTLKPSTTIGLTISWDF